MTITGPDRDDGLPSDKRGSIKHMSATHNELLAAVDATTAPNITSGNAICIPMGLSSGVRGY